MPKNVAILLYCTLISSRRIWMELEQRASQTFPILINEMLLAWFSFFFENFPQTNESHLPLNKTVFCETIFAF